MDYSKLSDEELQKLYREQAGPDESIIEQQFYGVDQAAQGPKIIQEEHPDLSIGDRLIIKNLSTSPESAVGYLKKKYPDMDVQVQPSGQIALRKPNEPDYRVLDPEGVTSLGEALKDIGDVGYDVVSGLGTGAATAAGGAAGAVTGPGALLTAGAAGAGTSAGFEGLRQGLGSLAGLEDNIDPMQIGASLIAGGVSPLLFGTGAGAKQIAQAGIRRGLSQEATEQLLKSQAGVPGRAFSAITKKVAPKIGGFLSGEGSQAVDDLIKYSKNVEKLDANPELVEQFADETIQDSIKKLSSKQSETYRALQRHIGDDGIDLKKALKPWQEELVNLRKAARSADATPIMKQEYELFKQNFDNIWGKARADNIENFYKKSPEAVVKIQQYLADLAAFTESPQIRAAGQSLSPVDRTLQRISRSSYDAVNQSLEDAASGAMDLKKQVAEVIKTRQFLDKKIGTPDKFLTRMKQASSDKLQARKLAAQFKNIDKQFGTKLDAARGTLSAADRFSESTPWLSAKRAPGAVIGGTLGYMGTKRYGSEEGSDVPGILLGTALGGALGGPRAIRALINQANRGGVINPVTQKAIQPAWNIMRTGQEQGGL